MTTPRFVKVLAIATAAAVLAGCPKPVEPGTDGGTTMDMDSGTSCEGQVGCACQAGVCQTGECLGNVCVDCRRGEASCVCRSNGTCNPGLRCASDRCETCPAQSQGCACGAGDTCGQGLTCTNGTCTPATCTAGTSSCPCRASDPKCDSTLYCDVMSVCQTCMPDVAGCPCGAGNACGGGLTCDVPTSRCRAPVTCASLVMSGACKLNQLCTQSAGADAVCVPNTCEANFKWDTRTSTCVACLSANCADEPTCTSDGGVAAMCALEFRECVSSGSPPITFCDACLPGYALNSTNMRCEPLASCGMATCNATEYCDPNNGSPRCLPSPCPRGQALKGSTCDACNLTCTALGETGQVWPFATASNQCICATLQGWFRPSGGVGDPKRCDEDNDGWVKEDADSALDPQLRANARCSIRKVDTVALRDELGIDLRVRSCDVEGLVAAASNPGCAPLPLRLLETEQNDVPGLANELTRAPAYRFADAGVGAGNLLAANALNSLTKACVALTGDFNNNGLDDIAEVPANFPTIMPARAADRDRLEEFAYFVELYTSFYVAPADGGSLGTLVIQENPRCRSGSSADFPLQYPYSDGGWLALGSPGRYDERVADSYWRNCSRRRDPAFNPVQPGFDFAKWSCAVDGGLACTFVPPPHRMLVAPLDPAIDLLRNHGVCEVVPSRPADGQWRGMNHHSQFKCVNVVSGAPVSPFEVAESRFQPSGDLVMNQCRSLGSITVGSGVQSRRPVIECIAPPGLTRRVGFAAVKYRPYGPLASGYGLVQSYQGGCVNEEVETAVLPPMLPTYGTYLCPWPEFDNMYQSDGGMKTRSDRAFGRYSCFGDSPNFLWAPADGGSERATLFWDTDAGSQMFGVLR